MSFNLHLNLHLACHKELVFPPPRMRRVKSSQVKSKHFQDLLSQHFFFCQINLNNLFS